MRARRLGLVHHNPTTAYTEGSVSIGTGKTGMDDRFVSFRGQDGNEAEEFIQAVRRAAFNANKDRDDEWMARFASTCMSGKALRWYESLDDDVQDSWKRLRKAILARYPPADEHSIVPSASAAPAAPAAPPPAAAAWPSSFPEVDFAPFAVAPPAPPPKPRSKPFDGSSGIIEVRYALTNKLMGHVSFNLRSNGAVQVTQSGRGSAQKFTVKNEPYSTSTALALNSGPRARYKFIGLTWLQPKGARAQAGHRYAAAVFTQGNDGWGSSVNSGFYEGSSEATIWDIGSDGKVTATSDGKPLGLYVYGETNQLNLFPDFDAYVYARGVADKWDQVNLIFKSD